jgi:anti-sigma-K factor RskA
MFEDDQETLAAEYVLGTLSAEEREHAEALRSFDPEFDAAVKQWERRLGELNVMVEAVEPPAEVWDKIKSEIGVETPADAAAEATAGADHIADQESAEGADTADFLFVEAGSTQPEDTAGQDAETAVDDVAVPLTAGNRAGGERGADIVRLRRRAGRWRGSAIALAAIAALLAAYIAVAQVKPDLIPPRLRAVGADLIARTAPPPERGPAGRCAAAAADRASLSAHRRYPATQRDRAAHLSRTGKRRPQLRALADRWSLDPAQVARRRRRR